MLELAEHLAMAASRAILPHFRTCQVELKADGSEVTIADRLAEEAIRTILNGACSTHAVLGEEFGGEPAQEGYTWVIDPIDGTTYFALGMPLFGTLIGLLWNSEPVLGVIRFPAQGETITGVVGADCRRSLDNGALTRIRTAPDKPLQEAFCSSSGIHGSDLLCEDAGAYRLGALARGSRKLRFLGDCQQHALLCRGAIDLAIDTIMQPWDIAALVPCVRAAGGVATSMGGAAEGLVFGSSLLTACGPRLHAEALELLSPPHPRRRPHE
jgi:histidinol-phosphatase